MEQKRKFKALFKDTIIFALGSLGSKLILFFLVPIYTNYLTRAEYGTADLVSTFSQLIIPFVSLVIQEAVIRFGMKSGTKKEDVALCAFIIIGLSTILTFIITPIIGFYEPISEWKWFLCAQIIFSGFREVECAYLKVKNRNRVFALVSVMQTAILATTNILAITVLHLGIKGYLLANIIAPGCAALVAFFAAGLHCDLKTAAFDKGLLKQMVIYSSPLILNNVSWWVIHSSDKIMIETMISLSTLGIYTAATKIPSLINVITGIFSQAWGLSSIREVESSNDGDFYSSVFVLYSTLTVGACICITTIIKPFMSIYVGVDFLDAWKLTPLLLSAAVFNSISSYFGSLYAAAERTINNMWSTIVCAITNVILNYFFIRMVGVWGAVIGTVVSYFVVAHIRMFGIKKYILISFKMKKYIVNILIMITQSILVSVEWNIYPVSIVAIALFIFVNWKTICEIGRTVLVRLRGRARG